MSSRRTILYLHTVHSSLRTTFFVVFAFLWKTGLVCPPYPAKKISFSKSKRARVDRTGLFPVVTAFSLSKERGFAGLVLRDLVRGVLAALLAFAVRSSGLRDVDHSCKARSAQKCPKVDRHTRKLKQTKAFQSQRSARDAS